MPSHARKRPGGTIPHVAATAPRRVLVVGRTAATLIEALRPLGYAAVAAAGPEEALDFAELKRPHIVLIAVGEPQLDGHELGRRLRSLDWGWRIALAAIAAAADDALQAKSTHAGFDRHIVAPLPPLREFMASLAVRTVD